MRSNIYIGFKCYCELLVCFGHAKILCTSKPGNYSKWLFLSWLLYKLKRALVHLPNMVITRLVPRAPSKPGSYSKRLFLFGSCINLAVVSTQSKPDLQYCRAGDNYPSLCILISILCILISILCIVIWLTYWKYETHKVVQCCQTTETC